MAAMTLERAALAFPAQGGFERGRPFRAGSLRGRAYAELPLGLRDELGPWLDARSVPGAEVLKAPAVFRTGDLVVKFFTQPSLFGWLRAPRAVRSAERHFWCRPLRSPRPLVAAGRALERCSVLVREHLAGRPLRAVFGQDEAAEAALAGFLAAMERHGVAHGDLHPGNLLWTGAEWVLLDADGLRHGLHAERRVRLGQWARLVVHLGDAERVERLFRRSAPGTGAARGFQWHEVLARAAALARERERALARTPRGPRAP
jgi:hypothetical protein